MCSLYLTTYNTVTLTQTLVCMTPWKRVKAAGGGHTPDLMYRSAERERSLSEKEQPWRASGREWSRD